jgi:protein-disulfide isomerase
MQELDKTYFQTGKVRFVFRDFPLTSIHKSAVRAAHAAQCAGDQGRYWQMHDALYASQDQFQPSHDADFATFRGLAGDIGLDTEQFMACMESRKYLDRITKEATDGAALGVRATPAYLVDGELVVGLYPTAAWRQILDQALARHGVSAAP